jgi:hypothetical protein
LTPLSECTARPYHSNLGQPFLPAANASQAAALAPTCLYHDPCHDNCQPGRFMDLASPSTPTSGPLCPCVISYQPMPYTHVSLHASQSLTITPNQWPQHMQTDKPCKSLEYDPRRQH